MFIRFRNAVFTLFMDIIAVINALLIVPTTQYSNIGNYDHLMIDDLKQAAIIVAPFVYLASIRPEMLSRKPIEIETETFAFDEF